VQDQNDLSNIITDFLQWPHGVWPVVSC
jgi:hypothetical protein